ncbi:hypothetical protein DVK02_02835 [Halobellus sp. Atlit-31R]|nr:hypothetical protein DVK02_02835 [Halobellus sp. Atlit-31R]
MTARAQANLIGFAVAVVVVTTVTVGGVTLANDALTDADRTPETTHAAARLAEHLTAADAAHTRGPNVIRSAAVRNLSATALDATVPSIRGRPIRVRLGGDVVAARGRLAADERHVDDPDVERVARTVRVERTHRETTAVDLSERRDLTLRHHAGRVNVSIDAGRARGVTTVRAGGRIVLHDPSGLSGDYSVAVPDVRPLVIAFESDRGAASSPSGTVTVSRRTTNASAERLEVSVGA